MDDEAFGIDVFKVGVMFLCAGACCSSKPCVVFIVADVTRVVDCVVVELAVNAVDLANDLFMDSIIVELVADAVDLASDVFMGFVVVVLAVKILDLAIDVFNLIAAVVGFIINVVVFNVDVKVKLVVSIVVSSILIVVEFANIMELFTLPFGKLRMRHSKPSALLLVYPIFLVQISQRRA